MDSSIKIKSSGAKINMTSIVKAKTNLKVPKRYSHGLYMADGLRRVDFVMAFKDDRSERESRRDRALQRNFYENNLRDEGLELESEVVAHQDSVLNFVKIHVPFPVLCQHAEELVMKTRIWVRDRPARVQTDAFKEPTFWQWLNRSNAKASGNGTSIEDVNDRQASAAWEDVDAEERKGKAREYYGKNMAINWPFSRKHMERYAVRDPETYFKIKERIEIAFEIMQKVACNPKEPKQRGIECLLKEKVYETAYPLHDGDIDFDTSNIRIESLRKELKENWADWKCLTRLQPLDEIRNYFGEKIAFYYAFMDFYLRWLIFPSAVGWVTFMISIISLYYNPEIDNLCSIVERNESAKSLAESLNSMKDIDTNDVISNYAFLKEESFDVSHYWMCPVCRPPHCNVWNMIPDGCFYYKWSFRLDNFLSFVLSSCTTLWAIIFLKLWRRREAALAVEWDTHDVEEQKLVLRPEYIKRSPMQRRNPITLEMEPYIPASKRIQWLSLSILATFMFLTFACVCLIALVMFRITLYGLIKQLGGTLAQNNTDVARWLVHGLLFIVAMLLEWAYTKAAHRLTNYECPKTEKEFLNSLLVKIFVFALLNDLIPIGYAAWLKGRTANTPKDLGPLDELCDGGCMGEVTELVSVLLLLRLVIGNASEIGIPLLKKMQKQSKIKRSHEERLRVIPQYVKDFLLQSTEFDGVYEDYMEMMIQFAFITLFIPALPVAPFVCFLNNIFEIRVDAMKMLSTNRRALPIRTSGIGIWNKFLDLLNKMGIIINAALLAFTSDNVPRLYYRYFHNPGHGDVGYTKFILSKIAIEAYGESGEEMKSRNITECWYQDYRQSYAPYDEKDLYWGMMVMRLAVFSAYCVIFFVIMWLVNSFVSDVPESATTKVQRRRYIVMKTWETERDKKIEELNVAAFESKEEK